MELKPLLKNLFSGLTILSLAISISSCEKNDVDEGGSVNLKVVNASPNSTGMSFILANNVLISGGLDYTESSDYINTSAGSRMVAQFRTEGSSSNFASGELWIFRDLTYTVYLAGEGSNARVKFYQDNLSAPASGKARVKFLDFSNGIPVNINIKNGAGNNLVTNLVRDLPSSYQDIDSGALSLQIYDTALKTSIGSFDAGTLVAGKIYTIYITGSSSDNVSVHQVVHN
ncbi:protein of unknown function [Chitinophaga sp. YR573]|uniref:DUF4397 domain-containing protein n=1 Tax=Chitinophaga sp. YR573 TaxID=1881040 RepID=UPI0008B04540|nr:DUF4397 domain-containing protein [Chitinophaga sp. YR573]SEV87988.1 protein of unknown function [Chitinophaga sp. YR573]